MNAPNDSARQQLEADYAHWQGVAARRADLVQQLETMVAREPCSVAARIQLNKAKSRLVNARQRAENILEASLTL